MVDPQVILRMARLARLELEPAEAERLVRDVTALLEHVASVEALATEGVPPTAHPLDLGLPRADDIPAPGLSPEAVLRAAPAATEGLFRVPPVLEEP